ncbi:MAG: hypothetical protein WDM89_17260 [Rhizomicrobium sp.]
MSDESAAGPKTDQVGNRVERVATTLEQHFGHCSRVLSDTMRGVEGRGAYRPHDIDDLAKYLKLSAQLAGQIGRLETIQNRNSKAQ